MSAGFTPGPWAWDDDAGRSTWAHIRAVPDDVGARGRAIAAPVGDDAETIANARLIAAAPELYEALERLAHAADACDPRYESVDGEVQRLVNRANDALAKARGEQVSAARAGDVR